MESFPSETQKRVIEHSGRPLVVVAGPGTGKTATIVQRMIRLLGENPDRSVSFLTFTRASRRDTDEKVRKAVGKKAADAPKEELPRVSTLHTFAKSLVHKFASAIGRDGEFGILVTDQGERELIVADIIRDMSLNVTVQDLEKGIVCFRSKRSWPADLELDSAQCSDVMKRFEDSLTFYNTFDMEGLVLAGCEIVSNSSLSLPPVFLQIDEFQDLNPVDQEFAIQVGAIVGSQVVVVGDDAQSIYGYRHANPQALGELWRSDEWDTEMFTECYRLPHHILRAAQALIKGSGYLGAGVAVPPENDRRVLTLQCTTAAVQLKALARQIATTHAVEKTIQGADLSYDDFMILCPLGSQVEQAAEELSSTYGIPTRQQQRHTIPESIWGLILVLRLLGQDALALRQWLSIIGVSLATIDELRHQAVSSGANLYDHCSSVVSADLEHVFQALDRVKQSLLDPEEFVEVILRFPGLEIDETLRRTVVEIAAHSPAVNRMIGKIYEEYRVLEPEAEAETEKEDGGSREGAVLVTTMHSAKGLESEFVLIPWLNARYMPLPGRDPREQERVLYVALTRAKQDVTLLFHEEYDATRRRRRTYMALSPFLRTIDSHLDTRRVRIDDLK